MLTRLIAQAKFVAGVILESDQYTHHYAIAESGQSASVST
jgi:hypothetical protein